MMVWTAGSHLTSLPLLLFRVIAGGQEETNLCTQPHLPQSELPRPQALPRHLAEFFSTYHFPQAHPGKAHCQPSVGFLWPSEVAARSTPGPISFPSSQGSLTLQHLTWEITEPSSSPELAADHPGKAPLGSAMCQDDAGLLHTRPLTFTMAQVCKVRLMSVCFVQMRELGWELSLPLGIPPSPPLTRGQHPDSPSYALSH